MKNILVPTDFSECANCASAYAVKLASKSNAKINFLHLQDTPVDWVRLSKEKESQYPDTLHEIGLAKSLLRDLSKKADDARVKAEITMVYGMGKEVVLTYLQNHDYDFMVMGSHGAKGLSEKLIGSNAQHMIRNAEVPVLVIKNSIERDIKKIIFASDFTDVSNDSFAKVVAFADVLGAHIDMLFVKTPKQKIDAENVKSNMGKLAELVIVAGGSVDIHQAEAETVETGIQAFANDNDTDLVAICTHGKSGLKQLFSPSIAEAVANHSYLPLLSIRL